MYDRYVPVGNRLSGIFCPIIVKPDDQIGDFKRIRNPSGARMRFAETQRKAMSGKPISLARSPSYPSDRLVRVFAFDRAWAG